MSEDTEFRPILYCANFVLKQLCLYKVQNKIIFVFCIAPKEFKEHGFDEVATQKGLQNESSIYSKCISLILNRSRNNN